MDGWIEGLMDGNNTRNMSRQDTFLTTTTDRKHKNKTMYKHRIRSNVGKKTKGEMRRPRERERMRER